MNDSAVLLDSNVWIALAFDAHPQRGQAEEAYSLVDEGRPAVFCRSTQQSFLRLATTPALLRQYGAVPFNNADALIVLDRFLAMPRVSYREEPPGLVTHWRRMASRRTAAPKVWMDAYLAAFAVAGDLKLVTFDRGFKAFQKAGLDLLLLKSA